MKGNKGFTLIEMAVVLGIIAILAAMLTPLVVTYIDQARVVRASADTNSIAKAYLLFYKDTSSFPVYLTTSAQNSGIPSKFCQFSGTAVTLPTSFGGQWGSASALSCNAGSAGLIRQFLNLNSLGFTTGNPAGGGVAFRGPYLDGLDANDPWGNPYIVNARALATNDQTHWAFAISAGPNGTLETDPWQIKTALMSTASDDITSLIR